MATKSTPLVAAVQETPTATRWESYLLLAVVFFSGVSLMALEMAGSRVIAPYFGMSIFTWGSLIGVFMLALSAGYYIGGHVADRWPHMWVLGGILVFAGLFTLLIRPLGHPICNMMRVAGPRGGPLFSSVLLFVIPSILMGMVSPFAVRLSARELGRMGNVAGKLYALSTFGSIVGTIGASFFLIPWLGTPAIIYLVGLFLIVVGSTAVLLVRRWQKVQASGAFRAAGFVLVGLVALMSVAAYPVGAGVAVRDNWQEHSGDAWGPEDIIHYEDSPYHLILVTEQDVRHNGRYQRRRLLHFNDRTESAIYVPVRNYRFDVNDEGLLAVADNEGRVHVLKNGQKQYTLDFDAPAAEVTTLCFSPDGKRLLAGRTDGMVHIWEGRTLQRALHRAFPRGFPADSITAAAWRPDGKQVALGTSSGLLYGFSNLDGMAPNSMKLGGIKRDAKVTRRRVNDIAYRPDGGKVAAAFENGMVQISEIPSEGKRVDPHTWPAHAEVVWSLRTHVQIPGSHHTYGRQEPAAWAVCWSADGQRLYTAGDNGAVRAWPTESPSRPLEQYDVGNMMVYDLFLADDGNLLACAGSQLWEIATGKGTHKVLFDAREEEAWYTPVLSSALQGPDGKLYAARADRTVWVAESPEAEPKKVYEAPEMPFRSAVDYTKLLHLGVLMNPPAEGKELLVVGGGGGVAPREFAEHYGIRSWVAEIDPRVVEISRRSDVGFGLAPYEKGGDVHFAGPGGRDHGDARETLKGMPDGKFDYIILDAYSSGGQIPFHLMTKEFLELCRQKLKPDGVVVSNLISALSGEDSALYRAEYKTFYAAGFKHVYTFPKLEWEPSKDRAMNLILVATKSGKRLDQLEINRRASRLLRRSTNPVRVEGFKKWAEAYRSERYEQLLSGTAGLTERERRRLKQEWDYPILTDDYAPVDSMYPAE